MGASGVFQGKRILITGGTGTLGSALVRRLLRGRDGDPAKVVIFSRDEGKQQALRSAHSLRDLDGDRTSVRNLAARLEFCIGDIRDYHCLLGALQDIDIVFNAAALKQIPTCEYFPYEAVLTNIMGAENIVRAIRNHRLPVETVIGISTDKAVDPVGVLGMTKAIQERIFARASLGSSKTRFINVRYGNVMGSSGSVIPMFREQIGKGGPVTITHPEMTRFLLSADDAVDVIIDAMSEAQTSETYVPRLRGARVRDIATVLIDGRPVETVITGKRPGEKLHEVLISDEEWHRTFQRGPYYVIGPVLPELTHGQQHVRPLEMSIASNADPMTLHELRELMVRADLLIPRPAHQARAAV